MNRSAEKLLDAGTLDEIRLKGRTLVSGGPVPIVVFHSDGNLHAVDNRCPHMGFPLHRGTVEDGILTCHWHHARFDLKSGCTFDLFADDATVYPVEVRDGRVYIDVSAPPRDPVESGLRRLEEGMDQNIRLVMAKAVVSPPARRGGPGRRGAGQQPLWGAPAAFGVVQRHDDPLGHGQRQRPPRRRRAHRPPVPGDPARGVGHQRPAAAGAAAAPGEQADPARPRSGGGSGTWSRCATPTGPSAPCWPPSRALRARPTWWR